MHLVCFLCTNYLNSYPWYEEKLAKSRTISVASENFKFQRQLIKHRWKESKFVIVTSNSVQGPKVSYETDVSHKVWTRLSATCEHTFNRKSRTWGKILDKNVERVTTNITYVRLDKTYIITTFRHCLVENLFFHQSEESHSYYIFA